MLRGTARSPAARARYLEDLFRFWKAGRLPERKYMALVHLPEPLPPAS